MCIWTICSMYTCVYANASSDRVSEGGFSTRRETHKGLEKHVPPMCNFSALSL